MSALAIMRSPRMGCSLSELQSCREEGGAGVVLWHQRQKPGPGTVATELGRTEFHDFQSRFDGKACTRDILRHSSQLRH